VQFPDLPHDKRLTAARLSGSVRALAAGRLAHLSRDEKLAEIRALTGDPEILGHQLGVHLGAAYPTTADATAIDLLRAAGADEQVAQTMAQWQQEQAAIRAVGRDQPGQLGDAPPG
jgi:hypothetical protein